MTRPDVVQAANGNQLLAVLDVGARERIDEQLEPLALKSGAPICEAGGMLRHAYFPETGVLSLLTIMQSGAAIETAIIGREGAFGLAAMYSPASPNRCIVQVEGTIARCPLKVLHQEFVRSDAIRHLFVGYSETLLAQIQQTSACNALHTTEERMCRWLLMMHDRVEGEFLTCSHELLSHMLGVNRTSITLAARAMQNAGLISYHRARIEVLNRPGLEEVSCECYGTGRSRLDAFLVPYSMGGIGK